MAQPGGLTLTFALHIVVNLFCDRFFLPRDAMLARYMPRPVSVSVRPCPSVSVTSRSSVETDELIKMVVGMGTSFDLSHTVL